MTRIARLLAVAACLSTAFAYAQGPRNLGFEEPFQVDGVAGWRVQGSDGGPGHYRTGTSGEDPAEGESCLFIGDHDAEAPRDWTYFHQYADAAPYRGRRVRLRAAIRTELGFGAGLRLYLSGTDAAFDRLAYVDTEQRPIESSRWAHYEVVLDVPSESIWVNFGLVFYGPLEAWLDDVSLEVLEDDVGASSVPNGDFETSAPGEVPWVWTVPFALREVCTAVTSEEEPHAGARCARIETTAPDPDAVTLGRLHTRFDATPFRGRVVELRAWVKVEETGAGPGAAHLGLQFWSPDGTSGKVIPVDQERPLRESDWTEVVRSGPVPEDAEFLDIDLLTFTPGIVWLDDVSLAVAGEVSFAGPAPLEGAALENLVAFTRLFGVIRYFHPSDQVAGLEEGAWPAFAANGVERVEAAADVEELAAILRQLFTPLAPTLQIFELETGEAAREIHPALRPDHAGPSLRVTRWQHRSVGPPDGRLYSSRRRWRFARDGELPAGYRDPADPVIVDLGAGLAAAVSTTLFRGRDGTLPAASPVWVEPRMFYGDDRTTRLVDVVIAWNVFQHFYPYFEDVAADGERDWPTHWHGELERALHSAATDVDGAAFRETLARMVAGLRDGHGSVSFGDGRGSLVLPIAWEWIEERLVVVASDDPGVPVGSVVTAIDGEPVAERLIEVEARTSAATPGYRRRSALAGLTLGPNQTTCVLSLVDADGSEGDVTLAYDRFEFPQETRPAPLAELEPGIRYVDISRVTDADFEEALPALAAADAVVLDFRGYPGALSPTFLGHLTDAPMQSPLWCVPSLLLPDQAELEFVESSWTVDPREPHVPGRLVFLTDSRAISYAETCMQIVAHHELGPIVGEVTAGTNGNVNPFALPGGYSVTWTGMRVLNQDRSRFHGVGVRPTNPVSRTIAGVRAGRDELLEAALELARR